MSAPGLRRLVPVALLAAAIATSALVPDLPARATAILQALAGLGPLGLLGFVALYVVVTVLALPAVVLTLGGGAVFGFFYGVVAVWFGATLGAGAAFVLGRHVARGWVEQRLAARPGFRAIDEAVGREGWKIVALTRLSPAFPFVLLNYLYGLTRVSLGAYLLASAVGMIPGIAMYVYLGSLAGDVAAAAAGRATRTPVEWTLFAAGLVATVTVTLYVTRLARGALARRTA